ncbi:metal-dependent transcriptional regulator [Labilibacter sediminis]|nr:metal-dependent transcriptional regulator [Labilibacter sediminis]
MNSVSVENFLKNIFTLKEDEQKKASTSILAERLGISGPAVTDMAKKLSLRGLILYQPYKEIELTDEGLKIAIRILRRHRIWEMFLHQVLHMDLSEVHNEAELLEHQTSDALLHKIDQYLGSPEFDPHGDPIPKEDGSIRKHTNAQRMDKFKEGETCQVVRLIYGSGDMQEYFTYYGITPNISFQVIKIFSIDQSMEIEIENKTITISLAVQQRIYCTTKTN